MLGFEHRINVVLIDQVNGLLPIVQLVFKHVLNEYWTIDDRYDLNTELIEFLENFINVRSTLRKFPLNVF
jgi:hypothetical protein